MSVHKIMSLVDRLLSLHSGKDAIIEVRAFLERDGDCLSAIPLIPTALSTRDTVFALPTTELFCGVPQKIRFPQTRSNDAAFLVSPGTIRITIEGSRLVFL